MEISNLPIIAIIIIVLSVTTGILYLRIKRYSLAIKEITRFAHSFLAGDFKRLYLPGDNMTSVSSTLNDMTSEIQKRVNDLSEERSKIEAILKCMSDGILITDNRARVVLANPAVMKLLNIKADITGEPVTVATRVAEIHNLVTRVLAGEPKLSGEIEIRHPERLSIVATAVPLASSDKTEGNTGVVLSLHDITRLRKLEDVRKTFVANVSHEIKTPITAIKGFAETLADGALYDRDNAARFLRTIISHSERINSLVDDLLTISRLELGDIRIEKVPVDVSSVIDTAFTLLMHKATTKGLYLKKSFISEPSEIYADKDRLIQILLNLIENGIKFTERGGITAGVENTSQHKVLFVEDTGIGIPKEHISRLGERFYRVDMARSRELGGTGLGLAIVKHLVKAQGWNFKIESTPGKGTKVKIFI